MPGWFSTSTWQVADKPEKCAGREEARGGSQFSRDRFDKSTSQGYQDGEVPAKIGSSPEAWARESIGIMEVLGEGSTRREQCTECVESSEICGSRAGSIPHCSSITDDR